MSAVTLQPLYDALNQALVLLLTGTVTALGAAAFQWLRAHAKFMSAQTDAAVTKAFETALENGTTIAINSLEQYEGEHSTVEVKGWIAAKAAQYAVDHNQDFMKRFAGGNLQDFAQLAIAKEKALVHVPPVEEIGGKIAVDGTIVTLGKPSPKGVDEKAETAALNTQVNKP